MSLRFPVLRVQFVVSLASAWSRARYVRLLSNTDARVSQAALVCVLRFKPKPLLPYEAQLTAMASDEQYRRALTTFSLEPDSEDGAPAATGCRRELFVLPLGAGCAAVAGLPCACFGAKGIHSSCCFTCVQKHALVIHLPAICADNLDQVP